ncbi:unnamed protein product [Meloidogyne enterolobii]|uniref:Uncharacterized protein n=1 Tax=Meloidogyne enterolobii TaxID=390850 RepID=A0ACB0YL54_MELEN
MYLPFPSQLIYLMFSSSSNFTNPFPLTHLVFSVSISSKHLLAQQSSVASTHSFLICTKH